MSRRIAIICAVSDDRPAVVEEERSKDVSLSAVQFTAAHRLCGIEMVRYVVGTGRVVCGGRGSEVVSLWQSKGVAKSCI